MEQVSWRSHARKIARQEKWRNHGSGSVLEAGIWNQEAGNKSLGAGILRLQGWKGGHCSGVEAIRERQEHHVLFTVLGKHGHAEPRMIGPLRGNAATHRLWHLWGPV